MKPTKQNQPQLWKPSMLNGPKDHHGTSMAMNTNKVAPATTRSPVAQAAGDTDQFAVAVLTARAR
jgi:hypothetical protein